MKNKRDIDRDNFVKLFLAKSFLKSRNKYMLFTPDFKPDWGTPHVMPGDRTA